jgi:hypothetical protein
MYIGIADAIPNPVMKGFVIQLILKHVETGIQHKYDMI